MMVKICIKILLFSVLPLISIAQVNMDSLVVDAEDFQHALNKEYALKESTPLTTADLKAFSGLPFFPVSETYIVTAHLQRTPNATPFEMPTTTARKPLYVQYGILRFVVNGVECSLEVYQNVEFAKKPDYDGHLFVPFSDETTGKTSYGGGRYLDVTIPAGDTLILNFNKAYNPYCAYNSKYSCPKVPGANHLQVAIEAGVKKPADH